MADSKINSNLDTLKKSVSDGKSSIASAITAKGVTTVADATFTVMAENIRNINTNPTKSKTITIRLQAVSTNHTSGDHKGELGYVRAYVYVNGQYLGETFNANNSGTQAKDFSYTVTV